MSSSLRLLPVAITLILAGCAGQAPREADAPYIADAENRMRSGDFRGAAQIYQQLVETSTAPDYYRISAADAELRAGDTRIAKALLSGIDDSELQPADRQRAQILRSRVDLNLGRAREAMARLDTIVPETLDAGSRAHYHTLRASAYTQLGNMLESARERVFLAQLLSNPDAIKKNNDAIYDALNRLSPTALTNLKSTATGTLGGWLSFVDASRSPVTQRTKALQAWRQSHPAHPAAGSYLESFLPKAASKDVDIKPLKADGEVTAGEPAPTQAAAPAQPATAKSAFIGVLLPLSGNLATAGQAIKTGISAAHDHDGNASKPEVRFIDSAGGDIASLYKQITDQGAQFVIGPLLKEDVAKLAAIDLNVPVLALNQAADTNHSNLYQFGLTPEQEVEQAAGSAWFDGRQNALLLAPSSAFGQRMIAHFSQYWKSLGGKLVATKTYKAGGNDFSGIVRDLLSSAPGLLAATGTQATDAVPAPAPAADFVFLVADSRDAHLLKPAVAAQQAVELPVYATSHVFSGHVESGPDQDLSGLIFCDIPFLLEADSSSGISRATVEKQVESQSDGFQRLIALGIDAYNLVPRLPLMRNNPQERFNGATGTLNLLPGARIQRQLHCAQFENGQLQPRGMAPLLKPSAGAP